MNNMHTDLPKTINEALKIGQISTRDTEKIPDQVPSTRHGD